MNLEQQVASLELAKKLKDLGITQDSLFYWNQGIVCDASFKIIPETCSAFTASELGELLGFELTDANEHDAFTLKCGNAIDFWWAIFGNDETGITPQFESVKFADALAELMIFLVEEKLMEVADAD